jgi:hypothetical protein
MSFLLRRHELDLRLRPERGLDIGAASFAGVPIAWLSPVGEVPGVPGDWERSWGGGLMTSCGLDNVGVPSEGLPQHGTYTYLAARDVHEEDGVVRGTIDDPRGLRVERTIRTTGARVELEDVTTNVSGEPQPALLLYHCNFLWDGVEIDSDEVVPRDAAARAGGWRELGPPGRERVYEHVGARAATVLLGDLRITVRSSLPRLWQWIQPDWGVLGIEPANCSVLGRAHDRAEGWLPVLEPGEQRTTTLAIAVEAR